MPFDMEPFEYEGHWYRIEGISMAHTDEPGRTTRSALLIQVDEPEDEYDD